jgi:hypothetical protein
LFGGRRQPAVGLVLGDQGREGRRRRRGVEEATGRRQGVPRGDEHLSPVVLELERQTSTREFDLHCSAPSGFWGKRRCYHLDAGATKRAFAVTGSSG